MARGQRARTIDDQVLSGKLREALAAHLYREAKRLGLSFNGPRVVSLCHSLLRAPVKGTPAADLRFSVHALRESALFNSHYEKRCTFSV